MGASITTKLIIGAIVAGALGLLIYLAYHWIDQKDKRIEQLIDDKAKQAASINTLQDANKVLSKEITNVRQDAVNIDQLKKAQDETNNQIRVLLGKSEAKIQGRDLEAIRNSPHREMLLKILNDYFSGKSKVAPDITVPTGE